MSMKEESTEKKLKTRTADDSTRVVITIKKADHEVLQALAKEDDRSLAYICRRILHEYVESITAEKK